MKESPYLPEEKILDLMERWDIHFQRQGAVYDHGSTISFKTENDGMFCEGYLKLIKFLCPNISWLDAQFLNRFITINDEKDYYTARSYKVWRISINALIDYMIDDLKLTLNVEIAR